MPATSSYPLDFPRGLGEGLEGPEGPGGEHEAKREVQSRAVEAVLEHFAAEGTRATVLLPGGTGKTVFGLRAAEALAAKGELRSVLVMLPTLDLVSQTVAEWRRRGRLLRDLSLSTPHSDPLWRVGRARLSFFD